MSAAPFGYGKVRASFTDIGLLIGRLTIAFIVFMHGWQKFTEMGYGGVVQMLSGVGAPIPQLSAALLILLEVVGSVALGVGVFTRVVAVLMALNMTGAILLLHLQNGFFVADGGYELALMIGGASLIYAFAGPGRLSIDAIFLFSYARRGKKADAASSAEAGEMLTGLQDGPSGSTSAKPAAGAATAAQAKPDTKTDVKSDSKSDTKSDTKSDAKPAATPANGFPSKADSKPGSAAAGSQSPARSAAPGAAAATGATGSTSGAKSETKPADSTGAPSSKPDAGSATPEPATEAAGSTTAPAHAGPGAATASGSTTQTDGPRHQTPAADKQAEPNRAETSRDETTRIDTPADAARR